MHYFLDPDFRPESGLLNAEESRHAIKALRMRTGDEVNVGDGHGKNYLCRIRAMGKDGIVLETMEVLEIPLPEKRLLLGLGATKNASRLEWWCEKSTELGIHGLMPLRTERTEHPRVNSSRLERIALAAAKQSQRAYLPEVHGLTSFEDALNTDANLRLIAHCLSNRRRVPLLCTLQESDAKSVVILVGPEGDFSEAEINLAANLGFIEVSLGSQRLRTETAGVYCAAVWAAMNDQNV